MELIQNIITNILSALYKNFNASVVLAVLFMFAYMFAREKGVKATVKLWINNFKEDKVFRRVFYLAFYTGMMLFRTVLTRTYYSSSLKRVMGVWGLYDANGKLYTENIENLLLFVPFSFLLLCAFQGYIFKEKEFLLKNVISTVCIISFAFSTIIELCQLLFRLGTFQLSDFVFNTLGGFVGGVIYYLIYRKKKS